ncbi:MAG: NAD(P)/FAD-dependent oxidoreductase, partial [Luteibaculum sp.]
FMDIEYQTYGQVPAIVEDPLVEFVWQHPTEYILLRLVYEKNSDLFVGVNAFGLRLRHSHFDAWLRTGKTVSFVLAHLADANFDPEFSKNHAMDIVQAFNKQTGAHIKLRRRSWKRILKLNPA